MASKHRRNKRQHPNGSHVNGDDHNSDRHHNHGETTDIESPLRVFGEAKKQINDFYRKLEVWVNDTNLFYNQKDLERELQELNNINRLVQLKSNIETIGMILTRNYMKVAFFGHTSNGKSTVINAILHDNVLPRGYGVTTKCFLQIQGTQTDEAYVLVKKKGQEEEKKSISYITEMANALNPNSVECSTLLKIFWPISKCSLLKHDVVFVDSPGVNVDENLDDWIDDYCHDADVFVLVSSSESTLNIAEKNFFHKVSKKLSKPNIFILNNRFDIIDQNEPNSMDQVREQHIDRAVDFLSQELKISTETEARQRTFFVSAKETLMDRCPQLNVSAGFDSRSLTGYRQRNEEFHNFEKRFEESLSKSAVRTKFQKYCDKGRETIDEISTILKNTREMVMQFREKTISDSDRCEERRKLLELVYCKYEQLCRREIHVKKSTIKNVVTCEFDSEIRRLCRAVEDFDHTEFSTDPYIIQRYKLQLYSYVGSLLSTNLKLRAIEAIDKQVGSFNKIIDEISTVLAEDRRDNIKHFMASQNYAKSELFDMTIYKQFYNEFQEDLEFRFSLGLVNIIRKFSFGKQSFDSTTNQSGSEVLNADLTIFEKLIMTSPQSPTTVGSLAIGGLLVRTIGWRVIVITTVVYGTLYAYEYLTWTNSAKEKAFKAQYVRYARKGLKDCVPIFSQHIANSVEQKMITVMDKLKEELDVERKNITEEASILKRSLEGLKICDDYTSRLLGESSSLMNELVAFAMAFLE